MAYTARLPDPVAEHWDWQRRAVCRGLDSSQFFHPTSERGAAWRQREQEAKRICRGCEVRVQCLEHALAVEEPYGTWGGVGERERWQMVLERRRHRGRRRGGARGERSATRAVRDEEVLPGTQEQNR